MRFLGFALLVGLLVFGFSGQTFSDSGHTTATVAHGSTGSYGSTGGYSVQHFDTGRTYYYTTSGYGSNGSYGSVGGGGSYGAYRVRVRPTRRWRLRYGSHGGYGSWGR